MSTEQSSRSYYSSHGHNNAKCSRLEGGHKAFIVVKSRTLRVALCNDSGLQALNGAIYIVFDSEYPTWSYHYLVHRQVNNFKGASPNKSVALECGGLLPSIWLLAMHSLFEGLRFWHRGRVCMFTIFIFILRPYHWWFSFWFSRAHHLPPFTWRTQNV